MGLDTIVSCSPCTPFPLVQVRAWRRERDPEHQAKEAEIAALQQRLLAERQRQRVSGFPRKEWRLGRRTCTRIGSGPPNLGTQSGFTPAAPWVLPCGHRRPATMPTPLKGEGLMGAHWCRCTHGLAWLTHCFLMAR